MMEANTDAVTAAEYKDELVDVSTDVLERRLRKFEEIASESRSEGRSTDAIDAKITAIQAALYTRA